MTLIGILRIIGTLVWSFANLATIGILVYFANQFDHSHSTYHFEVCVLMLLCLIWMSNFDF